MIVLNVTPESMDGPYQPTSRWGFRLDAGFGSPAAVPGVPVVGFSDGASYDVSYHIKVVAYRDAAAST